jgi:hypothetical protein
MSPRLLAGGEKRGITVAMENTQDYYWGSALEREAKELQT